MAALNAVNNVRRAELPAWLIVKAVSLPFSFGSLL
jgi:hypothetical protein